MSLIDDVIAESKNSRVLQHAFKNALMDMKG